MKTLNEDLPRFLRDGGAAARLIAARDWSDTLGPLDQWPESLKSTVGLIVHSPIAMVVLWGPDGIMIYNDAYSAFAGGRHPDIFGAKVLEAWPEAADLNTEVMKVGLAGGTLSYKDRHLTLYRPGRPLDVWTDLDYSPVFDESGQPAGVIAIVVETTERVLAERRQQALSARLRQQFEQAPGFVIIMTGPEHIVEFVNETHRRVFGSDDWVGKSIREAFPSIEGQGFFEALDRVYTRGETVEYDAQEVRYRRRADGPMELRYLTFVYAPIQDADGAVTGVFCDGYDVTDARQRAAHVEALASLSEQLRDIDDPSETAAAAARVLGETIGASRVGYGYIDVDNQMLHVDHDWTPEGEPSRAGVTDLRGYAAFIEPLKRNELVVVEDAGDDVRTQAHASEMVERGVGAFVNAPVVEQGRLVALLFVVDRQARHWSGEELGLIREIAERTRTAVERARSQQSLRESEARLRFLDALGQEAAKSRDADEVLSVTTRMVVEHLGVTNCAYADMDEDEDGFTIRGDFAAPGSPSIVGHYSLADFGKLAVKNLSAGQPLIVNDNLAELDPEEAATFQAIGITATICLPLVKDGRLTALMAIHDKAARQWTSNELSLIREVTERSWAHVERVGAEAELRASEENFRTLARAMPNQVWTAGPDGLLDWFNEQVYAFTGAEPGALDGAGWARVVHPDDLEEAVRRWTAAIETKTTYGAEFRIRRADGAYRWHLARALPLRDEQGRVVRWIGTNTDFQDQKETADALADLNATLEQRVEERTRQLLAAEEALRQAQKMEAVGQLTGGIAHDFNNLLTGISGSLEMLEKRLGEGRLAGVERYINAAQQASRRAAALTQRLLAFSRRQTLDPRAIDANRLVAGMEELIRRSVGPDMQIEVVGAGGLWTTKADPSQLENALLNLCINARDAMAPEGGRITIETANRWLEEHAARERDLPPGQYISLCVSDTGVGMPPEVINRAFDPFYTTKPLGEGTGLGLSMVYGFARQSGGQVRIYSEVGKGTTVCIYLPRFVGEAEGAEAPAPAQMEAGDGEIVLVVDDEPTIRQLIAEVLAEAGYTAIEAGDGPSALRVLQSDARIDLLITDVGLPGGMNGRQVADAARVSRPGLKVLFITGFAENAVIGNGHLESGMAVVTKPFVLATLGARIRDLIDG